MIDIAKVLDDYSRHPSRAEPEIPGLCDEIESLRELVKITREARDAADSRAKEAVQAEMAELRKRLATIRVKLQDIVCTEPPDEGVVLLSDDSTTHKEKMLVSGVEFDVEVYDHEHFSPLGDALIELYELTDVSDSGR